MAQVIDASQEVKTPGSSVGFWGSAIVLASQLPTVLDHYVPIVQDGIEKAQTLPIISPKIHAVIASLGALLALYGRWRAKGPLSFSAKSI